MIEKIGNVEVIYKIKPLNFINDEFSSKDSFLSLSSFTSDVISWLPIQTTDSVLEIGANKGEWLKSYKHARQIVVVERNFNNAYNIANLYKNLSKLKIYVDEGIDSYKDKFDFIFIRDCLGDYCLNETINYCKTLLNRNGRIVVLAKNTFALNSLANLNCVDSKYTKIAMSKKSLLKEIDVVGLESYFYYPYPNAIFPLKLFSDERLASISDLTFDYRSIERDVFQTFDLYKSNCEAIEEEMFDILSDSFLVILNDIKSSNDYAYIKISSERKPEYQISTLIKKDNSSVVKKSLGQASFEHLNNMEAFYQNRGNIYLSENVELCPCLLNSKNELEFNFIHGKTYNDLMNEYFLDSDYESIEKLIEEVFTIISHVANKDKFRVTNAYSELFGDTTFEGDYTAGTYSNVDMIMDNLIISDKVYIIDYEWCFNFPIPHEYILFRVLFFSLPFSQLKEEFKKYIYQKYGINEHDFNIFLSMEMKLQEYISGKEDKLSYYQNIFKSRLFTMDLFNLEDVMFDITIYSTINDVREILYYQSSFLQDLDLVIELDKKANYKINIEPVNSICYIKIDTLELLDNQNNVIDAEFSHNADLVMNDDYFFLQKPELMIESKQASRIHLKYRVLKFNEDLIYSVVNLLLQNQNLKNQLSKYENQNILQRLFIRK